MCTVFKALKVSGLGAYLFSGLRFIGFRVLGCLRSGLPLPLPTTTLSYPPRISLSQPLRSFK